MVRGSLWFAFWLGVIDSGGFWGVFWVFSGWSGFVEVGFWVFAWWVELLWFEVGQTLFRCVCGEF